MFSYVLWLSVKALTVHLPTQLKKCFAIEAKEHAPEVPSEYEATARFPIIEDIEVAYDFKRFFAGLADRTFAGFSSHCRLFHDDATGQVAQFNRESTEVHHLNFFLPLTGPNVAMLRYRTSSQSWFYLPEGADGRKAVGIRVFKEYAVLPGLEDIPQLADFDLPFKIQEDITGRSWGCTTGAPITSAQRRTRPGRCS